jgi:hypothetical protein
MEDDSVGGVYFSSQHEPYIVKQFANLADFDLGVD